jgi:hypothetical protein
VINGLSKDIILDTRALNLKKRKQKIEKAENNINWTSFNR